MFSTAGIIWLVLLGCFEALQLSCVAGSICLILHFLIGGVEKEDGRRCQNLQRAGNVTFFFLGCLILVSLSISILASYMIISEEVVGVVTWTNGTKYNPDLREVYNDKPNRGTASWVYLPYSLIKSLKENGGFGISFMILEVGLVILFLCSFLGAGIAFRILAEGGFSFEKGDAVAKDAVSNSLEAGEPAESIIVDVRVLPVGLGVRRGELEREEETEEGHGCFSSEGVRLKWGVCLGASAGCCACGCKGCFCPLLFALSVSAHDIARFGCC